MWEGYGKVATKVKVFWPVPTFKKLVMSIYTYVCHIYIYTLIILNWDVMHDFEVTELL